ncbi:MAG: helix-turn-helix transcriptional regulator [Gammaproteobacteria bacterium]|uniref:helix-turn-helix transcriptional regulator n=1 Tax=Limnobacter sp. TaxID=2003368 RepID=UPI001D372759|nr:helix-turn-helix transcriptional regulator [Limnobacter sp.]MBU0784866.1 helix-turn-helix transcriptional regulator [Gammaproteobacteria bacterium]MBU0848282.1 helix-turn-helix transcriptional regulator [Gammaproteobacteria bacterium]MBU1266975.1 helix-turn-helix transcriptional regulator [Gammaproteobacteria bacterium]MBU1529584.1 helix-turn-helix transcriptional regulator [Gammaproteobacteria bacterium]MBU1781165.1 helix-turn-helix transcriptional regulator [Gammaproteobacteria bacterium]
MNARTDTTEFLTTKEVAELLRIKERKLYDLVSAQEIPCVKATGKLLFPKTELMHWIRTGEMPQGDTRKVERLNVVAGSHDPLLEWAIRESACGLAMQFDGSLSGLDCFENHLSVASGLHVLNPNAKAWNTHVVQSRFAGSNVVLLSWATRQQGLIVAKGNPGNISGVGDLPRLKVATRQAGAGGMILFEHLLQQQGLELNDLNITQTCRTENDTVAAVASGTADAAPGLQALAGQFGLGFVPTWQEQFDVLVCRKAWFDAPFQTLMKFTQTSLFKEKARQFEGYNTTALGTVVWNA